MTKTIHFSAAPLGAEHVDARNGIVRGVSVITSGIVAKGHGLAVDETTLAQMHACARAMGQVAVKIDHRSGAASVVGFLTNFRRDGDKLKADWHLLDSHPQRDQILETAQRMPGGVGLSASFLAPEEGEPGKARCEELISVDYVTLPAANPDGLFSRRDEPRPLSGVDKVRRVIGAAGRGAEIGSLGGLVSGTLLRRAKPGLKIGSDATAATGAAVGALAAGALQWRRDGRRDFAGRVATIVFEDRAALQRLTDATARNISVPVPGADDARTVARIAKKPLVRRAAVRALKIGAGAGLGYLAGKRIGAKAGAATGAVAGLIFSESSTRRTVRLSLAHAKKVINL